MSSPDNMLSKSDNENFKHTDPELLEKNEDKLIFIYKCNTMLTLKTEYIFLTDRKVIYVRKVTLFCF